MSTVQLGAKPLHTQTLLPILSGHIHPSLELFGCPEMSPKDRAGPGFVRDGGRARVWELAGRLAGVQAGNDLEPGVIQRG